MIKIKINDFELLLEILVALKKKGIFYCFPYNNQKDLSKIKSDIDLVIKPTEYDKVLSILNQYHIYQKIPHAFTSTCFIIGKGYKDQLSLITIDLCTDFRIGVLSFLDAEDFSKNISDKSDLIKLPEPKIEFIYILIKNIFKGKIEREKFIYLTKSYLADSDGCNLLLGKIFSRRTKELIIEQIISGKNFLIKDVLLKFDIFFKFLRSRFLDLFKNFVDEIKRIIGRIFYPTGLFILFLGIDGSGKTTAIENLSGNISYFFRHIEKHHFRPEIIWKNKNIIHNSKNPHEKPQRGKVVSVLKSIVLYFDWLFGFIIYIFPAKIRSSLVIYDRGFLDILVDPYRYRISPSKSFEETLSKLLPKPDLIFFLDVNPLEAINRKIELPLSELIMQRVKLLNIAKKFRIISIDANRTKKEVSNEIEKIIMEYLEYRFKRRNGIFESLSNFDK
ncbi:MAG TPA: hypothetical protein DCY12_01290 [Candidatus Atribacteria bacterium]|nr:hypothetical protein [Candidatus Atribacteria bacterium]